MHKYILILFLVSFLPVRLFAAAEPQPNLLNSPVITLRDARAMTPTQLADMFLPADHPPIREVIIRPHGMDAPTLFLTHIEFFGFGSQSEVLNFCKQTLIVVDFEAEEGEPVNQMTNLTSKPVTSNTRERYGWIDPNVTQSCEQKDKAGFYEVNPENKLASLSIIYQIGDARTKLSRGQPIGLDIVVDDQLAAQVPQIDSTPATIVHSNGDEALLRIPLDRAFYFAAAQHETWDHSFGLTQSRDRISKIFLGDLWTIYVLNNPEGYITKLHLKRAVPAPF